MRAAAVRILDRVAGGVQPVHCTSLGGDLPNHCGDLKHGNSTKF
jgi:hypothetical protein